MIKLIIVLSAVLALGHSLSFVENTMPGGGRAHVATVVLGSKIYLFGGLNGTKFNTGSTDVFVLYTKNNTWSTLAGLSLPRYAMCSATDGEQIWVFGGYDTGNTGIRDNRGTYFVANNTWEWGDLPQFLFKCAAAYIPETKKVLLVLGYTPAYYMWDPKTDVYTNITTTFYSDPKDNAQGSTYYDNKLWATGSLQSDVTAFRTISSDGMTWTNKSSNPNGLGFVDLIQIGNSMMTFGGTDRNDERGPGIPRINVYDIAKDSWTTLKDELPLPVNGVAAAAMGPNVYLFGGIYKINSTTSMLNDKWWFVPCVAPEVCGSGQECDSKTGTCVPATPKASSGVKHVLSLFITCTLIIFALV